MFQVKDLRFKYPKNKENTIQGISFEIKEGEIFGLLGPSGVGKSTTQKILIKLLENYEGEVTYRGKDLKSYGKDFYQEVGVGFEMPVHFAKLTAQENVDFFKKLYRENANTDELLQRVGLYEDRNKRVSEFSKGMKGRLNFVRALLNKPKILILDEPTNGLDPRNARIIKDMIKEFQLQGGTVILTTHLMNDVDELCNRVAFMAAGQIVEIDSPKNLKLKHGQRQVEVEYEQLTSEIAVEDANSMGHTSVPMKQIFDLDSLNTNEEFMQIVKTKKIITIHSKETTLDDIFIKVTGVGTDE